MELNVKLGIVILILSGVIIIPITVWLSQEQIKPTVFTTSLNTVVFAIYPLLGSFLIYVWRQEKSFHNKMLKVCGSLRKDIDDTFKAINDQETPGRNFKSYELHFAETEPPLILNLEKEVTNAYFSTAAYQSMINSGSFENFDENHQISISTLYEHIIRYNESVSLFHKTIDEFRVAGISQQNINKIKWAYEQTLNKYLTYLGLTREKIVNRITNNETGINKIISDEERKFG